MPFYWGENCVAKKAARPKAKADGRQVADRWTGMLATGGWTPVPDHFLANYHRLNITPTEAMVIVHLVSFKWSDAAPFPSLRTIATRMGLTPPSVRTHVRKLEKRGFLKRQYRTGSTSRFHLRGLFDQLEALVVADRAANKARILGLDDSPAEMEAS